MRLSTFIDKKGNYFDAVHFSDTLREYLINGIGVYACYGNITNKYGFYSMIVLKSKKLSMNGESRILD